jgi:hypothetical protein
MKNLLQKFCRGWEIGGLNEPYSRLSPWDLCGLECVDTPFGTSPLDSPNREHESRPIRSLVGFPASAVTRGKRLERQNG